jgi:hypothetical protein
VGKQFGFAGTCQSVFEAAKEVAEAFVDEIEACAT